MRTVMMTGLIGLSVGLSGCSQISSLWKGKSDTKVEQEASLRSTPSQDYGFGDGSYEVDLYEAPTESVYAGYEVELYNPSQYYYYGYGDTGRRAFTTSVTADPREAAFVKLNGQSDANDWRNCETRHQGYLFLSEYDFRLDPEFEVCMRNKGYVLTSEAGFSSGQALSAQTAGLRGYATSSSISYGGTYYP